MTSQRTEIMRTPCPWCGAGPGQPCRSNTRGSTPTTLAAELHDARWKAATGHGASVVASAVADRRDPPGRLW